MSRQAAEQFDADQAYIMISVTDPTARKVSLRKSPNRVGLLELKFHDVDRDYGNLDIVLFDKEDARKIIDFVEEWKDQVGLIAIHCEAGISRSAAIAAALKKTVYGEDDSEVFRRALPNRWVYSMIMYEYHGFGIHN